MTDLEKFHKKLNELSKTCIATDELHKKLFPEPELLGIIFNKPIIRQLIEDYPILKECKIKKDPINRWNLTISLNQYRITKDLTKQWDDNLQLEHSIYYMLKELIKNEYQ